MRIHHRSGYQVVTLKRERRITGLIQRLKPHDIGHHELADQRLGLMDQQAANRQAALQPILAIHHKHLIGVAGQFIKAPQITQHDLKAHVIANRDHLEIHACADTALGI